MEKTTSDLVGMLEKWFAKAPNLPTNIREVLVKIAPIIAIIFGVLGLIGSLAGLGLLTFLSPFMAMQGAYGVSTYSGGFLTALIWLISSVLMLAAFPGLKNRSIKGWNMLFWSEAVSLLSSLIALNIISAIIGALIGFYILFQIKSYYK